MLFGSHRIFCPWLPMFIPCVNARGQFFTADGIVMVDIELAKAFLKEHHVATTSWHHVLNNTTSTRPKDHGGKVVRSLTEHKQIEAQGAGSATPMIRCTIRLPNSFAPGDGKVLEITGLGKTQDNASEEACCGAMVSLLCAEPTNVVLRPAHWSISTSELLTQFMQRFGQPHLGIPHQPLAVHNSRASPTVTIDMDDQKKQLKSSFGNACRRMVVSSIRQRFHRSGMVLRLLGWSWILC